MANGDDGFSEVGGGGSVGWKVSVNNGNLPQTTRKPDPDPITGKPVPWGYEIDDTNDVQGLYNKFFHVEIQEPPAPGTIRWIRQGGAIHLFLPIVDQRPAPGQKRQIRVMWAVDQLPPGLTQL